MDIEKLKTSVIDNINAQQHKLGELSLRIHSSPEVAFEEVKAADWLTQYLDESGFAIERGVCELPTAFRATYGHGKPVIGLMAEYDALPAIGHACGYNLISAATVGAASAS